jgi:hypothetical protein
VVDRCGGAISLVAALTWLALLGYSRNPQASATALAVGTVAAIASGCVGLLAGFILGLPRYIRLAGNHKQAPIGDSPQPAVTPGHFEPSSNLEQISDWLTKLLLGAGLVQLGTLFRGFGTLADSVGSGMSASSSPTMSARIVAGSVMVAALILGFLGGYIATSIWYRRRLAVNLASGSALNR